LENVVCAADIHIT